MRRRREDDYDPKYPGRVEDYTNAFLVSAGVLCTMFLWVIWAIWGFAAALFLSWTADRAIAFEDRRGRRD